MLKKSTLMLVLAVFMAGAVLVVAGTQKPATTGKNKVENATFKGTLVCLGCELSKAEGAHAACSVYGHRHVLKTADGKYISFLENKFSEELIKGKQYHGKTVEVHGTYYPQANVFDLETFTVDGKQKGWCDMHKQMDSCPFKSKGM